MYKEGGRRRLGGSQNKSEDLKVKGAQRYRERRMEILYHRLPNDKKKKKKKKNYSHFSPSYIKDKK